MSKEVYKIADGDLAVWLQEESGSICISSTNKYANPVELTGEEALELANLLIYLSKESEKF